jgi:hypothetical protein
MAGLRASVGAPLNWMKRVTLPERKWNRRRAHTARQIRGMLAQHAGQVEQSARTTGHTVRVSGSYRLAIQAKAGLLQRHQTMV